MSYSNKVTINGFELIFKRLDGCYGVFLNLDNTSIKTAISESSSLLSNTLFGNELILSEEFEALEFFNDKDRCLEEEPTPNRLYGFNHLRKLFQQAELVLNSKYANDNQKQNASHVISVLNTGMLERKF